MGVYKNNNGNLELISGATLWADAPIGAMQAFGGSVAPSGWFLCQGQALSRTDYAELFAVIGTHFGSGDGSTTFNLPDMREVVPVGAGTSNRSAIATHDAYSLGQFKDDQLQEHQHYRFGADSNGSFYAGTGGSGSWTPTSNTGQYGDSIGHVLNGRKGGTTHGKQLGVNYIIKAQQTALPADLEAGVEEMLSNDIELTSSQSGWIEKSVTKIGKRVFFTLYNNNGYSFSAAWNSLDIVFPSGFRPKQEVRFSALCNREAQVLGDFEIATNGTTRIYTSQSTSNQALICSGSFLTD